MPEGIQDPARSLLASAAEVRAFSGFTAAADISDADLQAQILLAQSLVVGGLTKHARNLELVGPIDGANTRFGIPKNHKARVIFDDDLDLATAGTDLLVQGLTLSDDGAPDEYATLTVASVDALNGTITLSAAPSDYDAIVFTGRLTTRRLDKDALKTAILAQTSILVDGRVREPGKVNLANPEAQKKLSAAGGNRVALWQDILRMALDKLKNIVPASAHVDTRLTTRPRSIRVDPGGTTPID